MTDRELMQQALDALISLASDIDGNLTNKEEHTIEALRKRLSEPEREWKGLTTAESKALWNVTKKPSEFGEMVEAKLKEKNPP
jgi:hypothetical protein